MKNGLDQPICLILYSIVVAVSTDPSSGVWSMMAADRNPSARRKRYFFSHASQWKLVGPLFTVLAIQFRRVWMHHPRLTNRKKSTANGRQTTTSNKNKPFTLREVKRQKQSLLLVSNVLLSVNYFDQAIFGWKGVSSHSFILANRGGQSGINSFVLTFNLHHDVKVQHQVNLRTKTSSNDNHMLLQVMSPRTHVICVFRKSTLMSILPMVHEGVG